ncbi:MAG: hypothetical protein ACE5EG_11170 [Thermoanaerobaculia bacterium]
MLVLRGTLARALTDSSEAARALREIKSEGWSLYLVVDQHEDEGAGAALELTARKAPAEAPVFKIDGSDLTFLRSIGIDPTRSLRKRRS